MADIKEVTEESFEGEVLNSDGNVVVDFSATWCPPCRRLATILEEVAEEMTERVKFLKVDVDNCQSVAGQYRITSVPTLIFFEKGTEKDRVIGLLSRDQLVQKIEEVFGEL